MRDVNISEFRANLLKYLKLVQHGEQLNVISKGIPLAMVTPPADQHNIAKTRLKQLAKTAVVRDVVSPTEDSWDAMT